MTVATVASSFRPVVPPEVRERLDLRAGDQLVFEMDGDNAVLRKLPRAPLAELRRLIHSEIFEGASADLAESRDDWDVQR